MSAIWSSLQAAGAAPPMARPPCQPRHLLLTPWSARDALVPQKPTGASAAVRAWALKMAPISGSFWPSWRVGMSLWSGGACFSLPLLHLNSAMGRERSDGKLKLAPPARHVGFFRSRSIKIGLILTPMRGRGRPPHKLRKMSRSREKHVALGWYPARRLAIRLAIG